MKFRENSSMVGLFLILIGFIAAISLAAISNHKSEYLVANKTFSAGHQIEPGDFRAEKASLWSGADLYLNSKTEINGLVLNRFLNQGELLTAESLSDISLESVIQTVPLSVGSSDLPSNLSIGDSVDIYQVVPGDSFEKPKNSKVILNGVRILSIDRRGQNLGNATALSIATPSDSVIDLLNATRNGRIVVVRTRT